MARYTNYQSAETDEIVLYDVALDEDYGEKENKDNEDNEDNDQTTTSCPSVHNNIFVSIWNFVAGAFSSAPLSSGSCHRSPPDDPSA